MIEREDIVYEFKDMLKKDGPSVLLIKVINGYLLDPARAMPVIAASWIAGGLLILVFERIAPLRQHGAWRDDPEAAERVLRGFLSA